MLQLASAALFNDKIRFLQQSQQVRPLQTQCTKNFVIIPFPDHWTGDRGPVERPTLPPDLTQLIPTSVGHHRGRPPHSCLSSMHQESGNYNPPAPVALKLYSRRRYVPNHSSHVALVFYNSRLKISDSSHRRGTRPSASRTASEVLISLLVTSPLLPLPVMFFPTNSSTLLLSTPPRQPLTYLFPHTLTLLLNASYFILG